MKKFLSTIMNGAAIVLSVLLFVFLSQPHITRDMSITTLNTTGYDMIEHYVEGNSNQVMIAVSLIFISILAAVIILCAILNILVNMGLIKNNKVGRIINLINIVSSIVMFVFALIAIILVGVEVSDANQLAEISSVGWGLILNFIISFAMMIITYLAYRFGPQTKKRK